MKRFRTSFLAIISFLAIGLTAATKSGFAKKANLVVTTNCYTQLGVLSNCIPIINLDDAYLCTEAYGYFLGEHVGFADAGDFREEIDCDLFEQVFCCATLEIDPDPCPAFQPEFEFVDANGFRIYDYARISNIYCKP